MIPLNHLILSQNSWEFQAFLIVILKLTLSDNMFPLTDWFYACNRFIIYKETDYF